MESVEPAKPVVLRRAGGRVHVQLSMKPRRQHAALACDGVLEAEDAEVALEQQRREAWLRKSANYAARRRRERRLEARAQVLETRAARKTERFASAAAAPAADPPAPRPFRVDSACPDAWATFVHVWPPTDDGAWWDRGYERGLWGSETRAETRRPRGAPVPENVLY